jgi:hypothetical protein
MYPLAFPEASPTVSSPPFPREHAGEPSPVRCVKCDAVNVKAATLAGAFVYLRCSSCAEVWAVTERRRIPRHVVAPNTPRSILET